MLKSVFLIAIVAVAMIGMMVPSAFAYTITDDATGGDCSTIGTWDSASRTCTLSGDISENIVIGANNIVLDGNGKTILGNPDLSINTNSQHVNPWVYYCDADNISAIQINAKTNLVIKNLTIKDWCTAISGDNSINNIFQGNTITDNHNGISLVNSVGDTITDNQIINIQEIGILLNGNDYTISNNIIDDLSNAFIHPNTYTDFYGPTNVGIKVESGDGVNIIENNSLGSADSGFSVGIDHNYAYSENSVLTIKNNNIINMGTGINCERYCDIYDNNMIFESTSHDSNFYPITGIVSGQFTNVHNNVIKNWKTAIITDGDPVLIYHNLFENNLNLFDLRMGQYVVENNFINNNSPGYGSQSNFNSMSSMYWTNNPVIQNSGNYWSDHSPLCEDTNNDNFCDTSYPFSGGTINITDDYVWKVQDGWKTTINTPSNSTVDAVDSSGLSHNYSVSATHDGTSMSVSCDYTSGSTFPIGVTDVLCTANNGIHATFSVTVNPPPPAISSTSPPTESNTTVEGNNLDLKIFATGNVQYLIDGITTVSTTWKDPNGTTVYQANLQIDASGNFNNEFDNPMYVRDMKDSGLYTTTVTYDDVTAQYTWNYLSTVYAAQQAAIQAEADAIAAQQAADAAAQQAAAQQAADAAAQQAAAQQAAIQAEADAIAAQQAADAAAQQAAAQQAADAAAQQAAAQQAAIQAEADAIAAQQAADAAAQQAAAQQAADAAAQQAAAQQAAAVSTNTIVTVDESGFSQTCAELNGGSGCYMPVNVVVNYGDTVTMTNTDPTGVHTFTSGTVDGFAPSPSQIFDSSVMMSGESFEWQANVSGQVPYYCMLHTWMVGTITVQGSGPVPEPTVDTSNDLLTITGTVINYSSIHVAIIITTPDGINTIAIDQTTPDTNGNFSAEFNPSNWKQNGYYTIQASSGPDAITTSSFYYEPGVGSISKNIILVYPVEPTPEPTPEPVPEPVPEPTPLVNLNILWLAQSYDLGDLVSFSISGNNVSGTQKVSVDVTDPTGNTVVSRSIDISEGIHGEIEFRLSENFKTGTYKITATTSDNGQLISETSNFKLKSQFNSFTISDVMVSDQQGNTSTLQSGEMGFIKVNLSSTKSIATLVTVNLFDSELTSIGIGSVQTTLASGESEIILSFMIPEDAAIGPADIYVNAFSDWPSSGGTALTGELASMEDIS